MLSAMNSETYHPSLRPVEEACRLAKSGWACVANPLVGWGSEGDLRWKTGVLLRHVALIFRCWRSAGHRHILVREFSTVPLLAVFPFLWPLRRKLLFLIHHNLQWAAQSRIEHFAFRLLDKLGANWAAYEVQAGEFAIDVILPHPVPHRIAGEKNAERPVLGVVGYYRPEKGMDDLLRLLVKHVPDCDVIAGAPNPDAVKIPSVRVVDTASEADYRALLARCDVLVQNGARNSYFFRASGPVADAAASGTAVVAPDFPLLRHQICTPVPVGETFRTPEEIPAAVRRAVECIRRGGYDFDAYCAARSAQVVASILDGFDRKQHG